MGEVDEWALARVVRKGRHATKGADMAAMRIPLIAMYVSLFVVFLLDFNFTTPTLDRRLTRQIILLRQPNRMKSLQLLIFDFESKYICRFVSIPIVAVCNMSAVIILICPG